MSQFKKYNDDEIQELLSNYLISSWSFSKVSEFARNEKAFEMIHIYGCDFKKAASSVAGEAYHEALMFFFQEFREGKIMNLIDLEEMAFKYIKEEVPANKWKISKTNPTIEECQIDASKTVTKLLRNFYNEMSVYIDDIAEILEVEVMCREWVTINGVDIPLPCHAKIDLVIRTKEGKLAVIDHKSKTKFTDEEEVKLLIGRQAITYVKSYESRMEAVVDEVWFVENKSSQNKDGSSQLIKHRVVIDEDSRRLYEALLYEPLKRMIEAVSDPNYVYIINDQDNFVSRAEIYDFWAKTMISEVEDFNPDPSKIELLQMRHKKIRDASIGNINPKVIREFKKNASQFIQYDYSITDMKTEEKIEHILRTFGMIIKVAHIFEGISSNTYLLEVSAGVKIDSIYKYRLDIANALNVPNVRIAKDLIVHEGKSYVGIETAKKREKTLYYDEKYIQGEMIPFGVDNSGQVIHWNPLSHSTPHVLVCGATGSGKSVFLISTIFFAVKVGYERLIILDPKYEFKNLTLPKNVEAYSDIEEIEAIMALLVEEMNGLAKQGKTTKTMIVFDEFADAVANGRKGNDLKIYENVQVGNYKDGRPKYDRVVVREDKSLEENMRILLQKGRSLGYRILAATQRASVKVITGDAKVNFPVQVCFRVPKEIDSKVVLDEAGAESLTGMGDGLVKSPDYPDVIRFQAFFKQ